MIIRLLLYLPFSPQNLIIPDLIYYSSLPPPKKKPSFLLCLYLLFLLALLLSHCHPLSLLTSPFSPSPPLTRCLSGARLYDLSWWLGQRWGPADVRRADRQIQPGGLFHALGLHLGYYGHSGRSDPLLPSLCPGEPTGWAHDRRAAGREQGWEALQQHIGVLVSHIRKVPHCYLPACELTQYLNVH